MLSIRTIGVSCTIILSSLVVGATTSAAQESFDQFSNAVSEDSRAINYSAIDDVYSAVTVKKGARYDIRYSALNQNGLAALNSFANFFANVDPTILDKDEQLAYWLNFRNLLIIRAIADDLPGRSFKRLRGDVAEPGDLWTRKLLAVNGVSVSIDDIEKKIILANWSNPNVLYGLYQGADGGVAFYPPKNFTGANVQQELAERGRHYINSRRTIRVRRNKATIPAVFSWYKSYLFGGDDANVLTHIKGLAESDLRTDLEEAEEVKYAKMSYSLDEVVVQQQRQQFQQRPSSGRGPVGS